MHFYVITAMVPWHVICLSSVFDGCIVNKRWVIEENILHR